MSRATRVASRSTTVPRSTTRRSLPTLCLCFFFQAEDGIRDKLVTGVQTCALPILTSNLEVRDVRKSFGKFKAVDGVSFAVPETGTIFGLLGPNGAGKTTTIRMIKIGRASCRERAKVSVGGVAVIRKKERGTREGES